jgi:hypothetical protein
MHTYQLAGGHMNSGGETGTGGAPIVADVTVQSRWPACVCICIEGPGTAPEQSVKHNRLSEFHSNYSPP